MSIQRGILVVAFSSLSSAVLAQQTGTVVGRTPGSAINARITSTMVVPKTTCDSPAVVDTSGSGVAAVPEMVFWRNWDYLVCLRHPDGRSEKLLTGGPWMSLSPDGNDVAYWDADEHKLHMYSIATRQDSVLDSLPGMIMREMMWASKGRALAYVVGNGVKSPAIRAVDLSTGKHGVWEYYAHSLVAFPDTEHLVVMGRDAVERISLADNHREAITNVKFAESAAYSRGGGWLGILANTSSEFVNKDPVASDVPATDDDGPDCTGSPFFLILHRIGTKQLIDVPYPKGFDTVLDYAFSPDERMLAVTFGVVGCDYPGERARVYVVTLPDLTLTPISPADRLGVKPVWSPDGKVIVYCDYTGSDSPLVAYDLPTHKAMRLTSPGQFGPDTWLGWR